MTSASQNTGTTVLELVGGQWTTRSPARFPLRRHNIQPTATPKDIATAVNRLQDDLHTATTGSRDVTGTVKTIYVGVAFTSGTLVRLPHQLGTPNISVSQGQPYAVPGVTAGGPWFTFRVDPANPDNVLLMPAGTFTADVEFRIVPTAPPQPSSVASGPAGTPAGSGSIVELDPTDLIPHEVANLDPTVQAGVGLMPPSLIYLNDPMTNTSLTRFTFVSALSALTPTMNGSAMSFTGAAGAATDTGVLEGQAIGLPQAAVSVRITAQTHTGGTPTYQDSSIGIGIDNGTFLLAVWRSSAGQAWFNINIAGVDHNVQASVTVAWTPPFDLMLAIVGNSAVMFQRPNGATTWTKITTLSLSSFYDFKAHGARVGNLWRPMLYTASQPLSGQTTTVSFTNFTAGAYGGVSFRDPAVVSNKDGTPILAGSVVTLTATATLPDASASAYCGVYTYDLFARVLTQIGALMVNRITAAGTSGSVSLALSGTQGVVNGSASASTSANQTAEVFAGSQIQFASQAGVAYTVQSITSTTITLTAPYTGTTNAATTSVVGVYQNDSAAHVVSDGAGAWHFMISSWGNAGIAANDINIQYKHETTLNLPAGGIHAVAGLSVLALPGIPSGGGTYDPYFVNNGSLWYLAYTIGPSTALSFFPSLASSPDLTTWTLVGQDTAAVPYEGSRIVKLAGAYWCTWTSTVDGQVYNLAMVYQGKYQNLAVSGTYAAHAMLVPSGEYTHQVTFDDTIYGGVANTLGKLRHFRARRYGVAV